MTQIYTIIESRDMHDLIGEANQLMREGYSPQGGVSVIHEAYEGSPDNYVYFQAMVRTVPFDAP